MHELSLCHSIHGIVDRARGDREVAVVHLRVGQLRQVVPDTLAYCWALVAEDGPLDGSTLDVDHVPVTLECHACGATTRVRHALVLTCATCDSGDVRVVAGEEFLVTSIDLVPLHVPDPEEALDG